MILGMTKETWDFNDAGELILVDKPIDWTSFDVVHKMRSLLDIRRIGHAGTLDPKATGLLIICTGPKTKEIQRFTGLEKEYVGVLQLGIRTPSLDSETAIVERREYSTATPERILENVKSFVGKTMQVPPMYSAVKMGGRPLYKYARLGQSVERAPKEVEVKEFEVTTIDGAFVGFRVVCSKGTYIRVLVDDMGQKLGCGASLISLRRTRIGDHSVRDALTIQQLIELRDKLRPGRSPHYEAGVSA